MAHIDPSELEQLTRDLVQHDSVTLSRAGTGGEGEPFRETILAEWIHRWLAARGVTAILQDLPDGRKNVFAFIRGRSARTVILMGHFDTVPPSPGQVLSEPRPQGARSGGGAVPADSPYLFGRGSLDMKSGIAVAMKLMEAWRNVPGGPQLSILFIATCDEEVESYGGLRAIELIAALKDPQAPPVARGAGAALQPGRDLGASAALLTGGAPCEFLGVLNIDYTTERYPGDPDYHVWEGTIGKLLAGVYVRGYQTHAGEYYRGFHAMGLLSRIITAIDGSNDIAGTAPPPVTLRVRDAKDEYNVMTSPAGWAYFNIFTAEKTPARVMDILRAKTGKVVEEYLAALNSSFRAYGKAAGIPAGGLLWEAPVITWSGLYRRAAERAGEDEVNSLLAAVRASSPRADIRETAFAMVARLLELQGDRDPAVVLMLLPPFYPYISPDRGPFGSAVREVLRIRRDGGTAGRAITAEAFYPYISDMSYLRLEPEIRTCLDGLTNDMPSWGRGYSLDFDTIGRVDLPVVNVGPYGFGAHQAEERVEREFSFRILPGLIEEIVAAL